MFCTNCGKNLPQGALFCTNCGKKITYPSKSPQPQSTPVQPQSTPVQPQSTPAQPQSAPAQPQSAPAQPQSAPVQPQSAPAQPKASPQPQKAPAGRPQLQPTAPSKKSPAGLIIGLAAALVLILAGAVWFFFLRGGGEAKAPEPVATAEPTPTATAAPTPTVPVSPSPSPSPTETPTPTVDFDYTPYIGVFEDGGVSVETYVLGDSFFYSISSTQPAGVTAQVSGNAPMDGSPVISFDQASDGLGNLVSGTLTLLDDGTLAVEASVTKWDRSALWGLDIPFTALSPRRESLTPQTSAYLWPADKIITFDDLRSFDRETVVLIRNEIFARYGYSFKADNLREYFAAQDWYTEDPSVNVNTFGTANMTDMERDNIDTIMQYERAMGWK